MYGDGEPIRLAEDLAVLDRASGGRFSFADEDPERARRGLALYIDRVRARFDMDVDQS